MTVFYVGLLAQVLEDAGMSIVDYLKLPSLFTGAVLLFAFGIMLSPYFGGMEIGPFRVPKAPPALQRPLKVAGPLFFALTLSMFVPMWDLAPPGASHNQAVEAEPTLSPENEVVETRPTRPTDSGRVTVTLDSLTVIQDGDRLTDGEGDFVWGFRANGKDLARQDSEVNLGNNETYPIEEAVTLTTNGSLEIRGHVTDRDNFLSGSDDRVDISWFGAIPGDLPHSFTLRPNPDAALDIIIALTVTAEG